MKRLTGAVFPLLAFHALAAHATTITVSPTVTSVGVGQQFDVNLDISGVNGGGTPALGAWDVTVTLSDPTLANFSSATFGTALNVGGAGDLPAVNPVGVLGPGMTELTDTSLDTTLADFASQPGSFSLAVLVFQSIASGNETFNVTINSLSDPTGTTPLSATTVPGSIAINPVPLPDSGLLLLCGVLGLGLVARSQRSQKG